MKSHYLPWLIVGGIAVLAAVYVFMKPGKYDKMQGDVVIEESTQLAPALITLNTQNNLGQSGTATLTEDSNGYAVVTLAMTGGEFPEPQPAHIHIGSCPNPGAIEYPLTNVVDGQSVTVLGISLGDLLSSAEPLAINVHKSAAEASVYTACGDIELIAEDVEVEEGTTVEETNGGSMLY